MRSIAFVLAAAASCSAQTWNTYTDFSAGANPGGAWTYGWTPTLGGAFTAYDHATTLSTVMPEWTSVQFAANGPFVASNPTGDTIGVAGTAIEVPPHVAWFHPGLGANEVSVYHWTAPAAGQYTVSASFQKIDLGNTIQHQGSVLVAGQVVFSQPINTDGTLTSFPATGYALSAGQNVDFAISVIGSPAGGAYAINGTVAGAGCYANCDHSTSTPVLNVADFTCFLQKFAAGDPYANCDGSTSAPVLNVADFTCFLQKFAAGCP